MKIQLDHVQRLNLHTLLDAQRLPLKDLEFTDAEAARFRAATAASQKRQQKRQGEQDGRKPYDHRIQLLGRDLTSLVYRVRRGHGDRDTGKGEPGAGQDVAQVVGALHNPRIADQARDQQHRELCQAHSSRAARDDEHERQRQSEALRGVPGWK